MAQNPRMFISTHEGNIGDMEIGGDINSYDSSSLELMPKYMTALNTGLIFYNKKSKAFLNEFISEYSSNPSRGQAALARTIWKTKIQPYTLSVNWLVCQKHQNIECPLSLHVGHRNIYDWWKKEYLVKNGTPAKKG